jgi:hypothetical protein
VATALRIPSIRATTNHRTVIQQLSPEIPHFLLFFREGVVMKRFIIGVFAVHLLQFTALAVRADRLEAIWIGLGGNGGEGNWNTPSNWNLGVVPNNGADANGDGVPDIFDVRIDGLPAVMSFVHSDAPPAELAGLSIDEGDILELTQQPPFVLRDPDGEVNVINNGLVRIGGRLDHSPMLAFRGHTLRLSGRGIIELGIRTSEHARLAALDGGRIINGPTQTLRSTGLFQAGHINGYVPDVTTGDVALTNEGLIIAEDRGSLSLHLSGDTHYNRGTMRATANGRLSIRMPNGRLSNGGLITAVDGGQVSFQGGILFNDSNAVVRASGGTVRFFAPTGSGAVSNAGLIEAVGVDGIIQIDGKDIFNQVGGVVRAISGGTVALWDGRFNRASAYQIMDAQSTLSIVNSVYENHGSSLSAGPGILELSGAHIIGGHLTNWPGELRITGALLEDVAVSGTARRGLHDTVRVTLKGTIDAISHFTVLDNAKIFVDPAGAILQGRGNSKFQAVSLEASSSTLEIESGHWAEFTSLHIESGELQNNGAIVCDGPAGLLLSRGTLSGNGAVVSRQIRIDDVLSPGDGIGILTLVGDVQLGQHQFAIGVYRAQLDEANSDLLNITGNFDIGTEFDRLQLTGGVVGQSYLITRYTGERTGVFDNVTPGYNVIYDDLAKQIRVEPIPEPVTILLVLIGLCTFAIYRGRRTTQRKGIS